MNNFWNLKPFLRREWLTEDGQLHKFWLNGSISLLQRPLGKGIGCSRLSFPTLTLRQGRFQGRSIDTVSPATEAATYLFCARGRRPLSWLNLTCWEPLDHPRWSRWIIFAGFQKLVAKRVGWRIRPLEIVNLTRSINMNIHFLSPNPQSCINSAAAHSLFFSILIWDYHYSSIGDL